MGKYFHNILIVCGSGRKVGKTTLICSIINNISKKHSIVAIKISPHFHQRSPLMQLMQPVEKEEGYNIYMENNIHSKDSSLFLQAGANPVYYIEALDQNLERAFYSVLKKTGTDKLIVIESGYLGKIIKPAILVYLKKDESITLSPKKYSIEDKADMVLHIKDKLSAGDLKSVTNNIVCKNNNWYLQK